MDEIREELAKIIEKLFGIKTEVDVTVAPENFDADYSSNIAMKLAKEVGKNPREIAGEIVNAFSGQNGAAETDDMAGGGYEGDDRGGAERYFDVEIAGPGFLNFKSRDEYFKQKISDFCDNFTKNISQDEYSGQVVVCEFSDPNPFKVLHIGHLYTSVVGDSISRLVEFAGGKVIRANFGGDVGLHVAKNLYACEKHLSEFTSEQTPEEVVSLLGKCYVEGTNAYESDDDAVAEITELNKKIFEISTQGEPEEANFPENVKNFDKNEDLAAFYWWARKNCYAYFADFYKAIGLKFDKYYPESTVAERGLTEVRSHVGPVYETSDGAIVFHGENYDRKLHTRVFINKNGLPTYETKDIGLLFTKFDDYHFDKSIVITGNDIIDYMKVVLKSVEQYAPELVEKTVHLTHGNVTLPGREKMSSRKGNFVRAIDVLEDVKKELALSRSMRESSFASDVSTVDEKISFGAIKYSFLKYKVGTNFDFDIRESVKMSGNSGPYLQYSAVRAGKILGKAMEGGITSEGDARGAGEKLVWELSEHERNLIRKLLEYKNVLGEAVASLSPNLIANYLYELAQVFSRFYENVKVAGSEFERERAEIVLVYLKVLTHGLSLLGIEVPEKM